MLEARSSRLQSLFTGPGKVIIAMAHVPALPGTPMYDPQAGIHGVTDVVQREVDILLDAGVDAILFCNENDRPYELTATLASAAVMTRVVADARPTSIPFGVDFLWDPHCALAVALATGADFIREVVTGVWESDMGLWQPDAAKLLRDRSNYHADEIGIFANVTPEFASPIGGRSPAQTARSVTVSSLADVVLVSGSMAGAEPSIDTVASVREAVDDDVPVLLNTGATAGNITNYLPYVNGCIVGSDLKFDGRTWNAIDRDRAKRFVDTVRTS